MKRLFAVTEERVYDYQKVTEADKHVKEMKAKGWMPMPHEYYDDGTPEYVYNNGQDDYKWSVRFTKSR